ncbi:DUF6861 domain-containing protein [Rhodanobacter ginsengisoli]|uniref:DUF6861 domain-containing protein n=1 Tax=Rhodanobacter ginsengisoli TaxID=418646 RepID=A0ABW0QXZ4_9GAMM
MAACAIFFYVILISENLRNGPLDLFVQTRSIHLHTHAWLFETRIKPTHRKHPLLLSRHRESTEGTTVTRWIDDSWRKLHDWAGRQAASLRGEARLIATRADCLQLAIERSEGLATDQIVRDFHELDVREVINNILAVLRQCLIVMITSTGGGALIGGIAGGIGGVGVGAIPGVAIGAAAGAQVGEWILIVMGLKALTEYIVHDMPAIARNYREGLCRAWLAASSPPLPQQQVRVDAFALQNAAATLARGHVAMFVLLLMGIVAYLAKGRGSIGELADNVRNGKLGSRFADWMVRNEEKLKAEPRLQTPISKPGNEAADGPVAARARPRRVVESKRPEPVSLTLSVAQKRQLARDFYLKQGYGPKRVDSHLAGIDFDKPVEVVTLPKGTLLEQWQAPRAAQGNYYSPPGTPAEQLGISPVGLDPATGQIADKVATTYVTNSEVEVLKSTAAAVNDTWSVPGQVIATEGKGTQMLSAQSGAFDAVGGGQ